VFYEVGYAHAKEKLCVLLTSSAEDIPFDLKHHRHITYKPTALHKLQERLTAECKILVEKLKADRKGLAVAISAGWGSLLKSEWSAKGEVDIHFDIVNETDMPFDVQAMYFYTGKGWRFSQDVPNAAQLSQTSRNSWSDTS
jgi:hypothetical protein